MNNPKFPAIKDLIKDNTIQFDYFRAGYFYYMILHDGNAYTFPVPLSDIGDATLLCDDKAIYFMRYIRKAMDEGTFVKV